jgi:hypothetical protein
MRGVVEKQNLASGASFVSGKFQRYLNYYRIAKEE